MSHGDHSSLYHDGVLYDMVMGHDANDRDLIFYQKQIARYGQPVLELACGTGRFTISLAAQGIAIMGIDNAQAMLDLAHTKAAERHVPISLRHADMRSFDLGQKYKVIFIPAQSLSHLHTRQDLERCFSSVRQHLCDDGRFVLEIFNPSVTLLARTPNQRYLIGPGLYEDPTGAGSVHVSEEVLYDSATQINHIRWFYEHEATGTTREVRFEMRQFYPQEMDALLAYNGFVIEHKYGGSDESVFSSASLKQLIICRSA